MTANDDDRAASDGATSNRGVLAPKRTLKTTTIAVMALTAVAALLLALSIRRDATYAMSDYTAVDLGSLADAEPAAHDNGYVRVQVALEASSAEFRRRLEPSRYRVAKDGGSDRWVIYSVPDGYSENRFMPPKLVAGRLTQASDLGARFGNVAKTTGSDAWVVVDGDDPRGSTWLLGLLVMLLGFVTFNVVGMATLLRPVR